MRLLLFTGEGGVGKSTLAAATAVHAARCGVTTLHLAGDGTRGPDDVWGFELGSGPGAPVDLPAGAAPLRVRRLDPWAPGSPGGSELRRGLTDLLGAVGGDLPGEELTVLPGVEELLVLSELAAVATDGSAELVIVDCPAAAATLRLLAWPEALGRYLDRALPVERRVLLALGAAARPGARRRAASGVAGERLVELAGTLRRELDALAELLGSAGTSVRLVAGADPIGLARAARTRTALALHGLRLDAVLLAPGRDAGAVPADAAAGFAPVPVRGVPLLDPAPSGPRALARLGERLHGVADPAGGRRLTAPVPGPAPVRVEPAEQGYALVIDLPAAQRREVEASRNGDDLAIRVGAERRVFTLPSGLRRCQVAGASLREGRLRIEFTPDPGLWPARSGGSR